jgi:hypothetical protein
MAMADEDEGAPEGETIITTPVLCQLLMLSRQRVEQLVNEGYIKRHARGQYSLVSAVQGYIKFLRDETRRQNVSAADSRIRDARAKDIEVRTAVRLSQLVPRPFFEEMIEGFAGVVRMEFAGVAATCSRDLTVRRTIEREINARLRRIAEYAMAQAIRLETVRGTDDAFGADGTGPVGGSEPDVSANGSGAGAA